LFPASRASISVARTYRDGNGVRSRMDAHRNKALGNAVVPQIVEMIGRAIVDCGA
jgi:site-specific DNA-cytosine methylase